MKSIKRVFSAIVMLVMIVSLMVGSFSVSAAAATTCSSGVMVVDDDLASAKAGSSVTVTVGGVKYTGTVGKTAFATIQGAYKAIDEGGSIYVAAGVYNEGNVALHKNVALYGNQADVNPNSESDVSAASGDRAITGGKESILQNVSFSYAPIENGVASGVTGSFTLNGFAIAGDSAIYLVGERLSDAEIEISHNVMAITNESVYSRLGVSDTTFYAITLGVVPDTISTQLVTNIVNNRILSVSAGGSGISSCGGIAAAWTGEFNLVGNYIADTSFYAFSIAQPGLNGTTISGNYILNSFGSRVYDGIRGTIEVVGNTFDRVGGTTATGDYALGLYATANATTYNNTWFENTESVLVHGNTFLNVGCAIDMYARLSVSSIPVNSSPYGAEIYDNVFVPMSTADCRFVHLRYADGLYNPRVYKNYTGGLNPKDVCVADDSAVEGGFAFDHYWLDERKTISSENLSILRIYNDNAVTFSSDTTISVAPDFTVLTSIALLDEVHVLLEVSKGAYYELYTDNACTTRLPNDTLNVKETGPHDMYAKVYYAGHSAVYHISITKKVTYSSYLAADQIVVNQDFGKYQVGQSVYMEMDGQWRRGIMGYSAFASLNAGVNGATEGDTIIIAAGTYEENISISKGVKLQGAKAGIDPNDRSSATYERSAERSNENEETILTNPITMAATSSGLSIDGVSLKVDASLWWSDAFVSANDVTIRNVIISNNGAARGLGYKARKDNGESLISNMLVENCRFDKQATYFSCIANFVNCTFKNNVFYQGSGYFYIGGADGGFASVNSFIDNIWYKCTASSLVNCAAETTSTGSNAGARNRCSWLFEGNTFKDCTGSNIMYLRRWVAGNSLTVVNNRFEGTTKAKFDVMQEPGFAGQSIDIHENYFGTAMTTVLTSSLDATANCSHNYYAAGNVASRFAGNANYIPYYTDEAMTTLEGAATIERITAPEGAQLDHDAATIQYECAAETDEVAFELEVGDGEAYQFYEDYACTEAIADNTVQLAGMRTTVYVKVTTSDETNYKIYTVTITKPINSGAELRGIEQQGSTLVDQGDNTFICYLPATAVIANISPVTSSGASFAVYAESDTDRQNPIDPTDVTTPVGNVTYIIVVTSEDSSTTKTYTVKFRRSSSPAADLIAIHGALDDMVLADDGLTATVVYPHTTTSVIPDVEVSAGATYEFYEDAGYNILKTDAYALAIGDKNRAYLKVTAEDGVTVKNYVLCLTREDLSGENSISVNAFPSFAWTEAEFNGTEVPADGVPRTYLGMKYITNYGALPGYDLPYVSLTPTVYMDSLQDETVVSEGATYDIFKTYKNGVLSGLLSSQLNVSKIPLTGGVNDFFIRVTAANNESRIFVLRVNNKVKSDECKLLGVDGFNGSIDANNVGTYTHQLDNPTPTFLFSEYATAKIYADKKKTIRVATIDGSTVDANGNACAGSTLADAMTQPYVVYYIDVTSESGKKASYTVKILTGTFAATFEDVSDRYWAAPFIQEAYTMGVTTGSEQADGTVLFRPTDPATRQEIAIFICNLLGVNANAYSGKKLSYSDANKINSWARNAVKAVTALGLMEGDSNKFNPKDNITREEFMTVMVRAAALDTSLGTASQLAKFRDKNKVSGWAKVFVQTAVAYGLVEGDNGYLYPRNNINRAEIVKIMVSAKDFVR